VSAAQFLLDANVCIHLINKGSEKVVQALANHLPSQILIPSIVVGELVYGAYLSARQAENTRLVQKFIEPFSIAPFDKESAEEYGEIRAHLKQQGQMIGANDLIIAATAKAHGYTLVSHNTAEFGRVVGLRLVDWQ
jgi:tRNA(fMet)-specific endonuclease VapC